MADTEERPQDRPQVEFGREYRMEFFAWGGVKVIHVPPGRERREFFLGEDVVEKIARRWLGIHRNAPAASPLHLLFDSGDPGEPQTQDHPGAPAVPPTLYFTLEAGGEQHHATLGYLEDATYPVEPKGETDDGVRVYARAADVGPYLVAAYNFCRLLGWSAEGLQAYVAAAASVREPLPDAFPGGIVAPPPTPEGGSRVF